MIKKSFLILSFAIVCYAHSQVGIQTSSPNATLDIEVSNSTNPNSNEGLLIPRLDSFPLTNPSAAQNGMMVFLNQNLSNINISGVPQDYIKGFYYWDDVQNNWIGIGSSASSGDSWNILGNSGTNSGTNFLGTTDNEDLDFRTNNNLRMRLTQKGQLEFFEAGNSIFLGFEAGNNDNPTTNDHNAVFLGYQAGRSNSLGIENIGVGFQSLRQNVDGDFNTVIGTEAGEAIRQDGNTVVGHSALRNLQSGEYNVVLGFETMSTPNNGSNNVVIGYQADITGNNVENDVIIGQSALVSSNSNRNSILIGGNALLSGNQNVSTIVIGGNAAINGNDNIQSILIGSDAQISGSNSRKSIVIGAEASINSSLQSIVIGESARADSPARDAIVLGPDASTELQNSIVIGHGANSNDNGINARNSIAIGTDAESSFTNSIAFGRNATTTQANQIRYGNISQIDQINATVVNASDGRFKRHIRQDVKGLEFILKLKPVTYTFDIEYFNEFFKTKSDLKNSEIRQSGLIAQEVEQAMIESGYNFDGLIVPSDSNTDNYKISYQKFVVPLIKSVQEQHKQINDLRKELEFLKQVIAEMKNN